MARIAALAALMGSCTTGVMAIRGHEFADLKLEEESGSCKRWCSVMDFATFNSLAGDEKALMAKADEKCVKSECKGCVRAPGDVTKPDCRPPVVAEPIKEPEVVTEKVVEETTTAVPEENPALPGEVCQLVEVPWCPAPARNPGQKYRKGSRPMCCSKIADSNMEGSKEAAEKIEEVEIATQKFVEEPTTPTQTPAPLPEAIAEPVCGDGPFAPEDVQQDGSTVSLCRDTVTKSFAKNFCCEAAVLQLLKDKETASEKCGKVERAHCKPSPLVFEGKRNKYPSVPESYTCVRMYMCTDGKLEFGPVKNQALCMQSATGMKKNLPAVTECVAIKK